MTRRCILVSRTLVRYIGRAMAIASAVAAPAQAAAFEFRHASPDFRITVPDLPDMAVEPGPAGQFHGRQGAHGLDIQLSAAERPANGRACAGQLLRALVARPGMPVRDAIYRAPLGENTFLVIYQLGAGPHLVLHAHLLAAAGAAHCVEAHFMRPALPQEDEDDWRRSFQGARVD